MPARITDTTTFDLTSFAEELRAAPNNLDVGTRRWLENDAIRVWEVRLKPGKRNPCTLITREYSVGDFENAGDTDIRFVTVELLD